MELEESVLKIGEEKVQREENNVTKGNEMPINNLENSSCRYKMRIYVKSPELFLPHVGDLVVTAHHWSKQPLRRKSAALEDFFFCPH